MEISAPPDIRQTPAACFRSAPTAEQPAENDYLFSEIVVQSAENE